MQKPRERNFSTKREKMQTVCATRKRPRCKTIMTRMGGQITRMAAEEVFGIARKALADLATVSLEERIGEVFTRHLHEMRRKR